MKMKLTYLLLLGLVSCSQDAEDLAPVEERVEEAIEDLRDELTGPANGWKVLYQPVSGAGTFLMLLSFDEDGLVMIASDVAANDGEFYEQTIPYRIDNALGLELIFETYGVFHYLFELEQAAFGAEFEFLFVEEDGGNLVFESKSDLSEKTVIVFEPASGSDGELFSREIAENFMAFEGQSPELFGGKNPSLQLYSPGMDLSLFWSIDLVPRVIHADVSGLGFEIDAIVASGTMTSIDHTTGFSFINGNLILSEPFNVTVDGQQVVISEVVLNNFSQTGSPLCAGSSETTPVYTGTIQGLGEVVISKSLFSSDELAFQPQPDQFYSVNIPFIFDDSLRSLYEEGSIAEKLPDAAAFIMPYGFESDSIPAYAVGFLIDNGGENLDYYLRSFAPTTTSGNRIAIDLLDEFYYSGTPGPDEEQSLVEITDEIFAGGNVYAYSLPIQGLTAFQFYNPCNGYEFVLVQ